MREKKVRYIIVARSLQNKVTWKFMQFCTWTIGLYYLKSVILPSFYEFFFYLSQESEQMSKACASVFATAACRHWCRFAFICWSVAGGQGKHVGFKVFKLQVYSAATYEQIY